MDKDGREGEEREKEEEDPAFYSFVPSFRPLSGKEAGSLGSRFLWHRVQLNRGATLLTEVVVAKRACLAPCGLDPLCSHP